MSHRPRSNRWGNPQPPSNNRPNAALDDDSLAMAALLNDATARSEKEQQHQGRQTNPRHPQNRDRDQRDRDYGPHGGGRGRDHGRSDGRRSHDGKRIVEDEDDTSDRNSNNKRRRRRWNDANEGDDTGDSERWGRPASENVNTSKDGEDDGAKSDEPNPNKVKADFGLSGALAQDTQTGNVVNGITLKFSEPPEARIPNTRWRLYVFRRKNPQQQSSTANEKKDDDLIDIYHISRQSAYLFGRERKIADIPVDHPSLSKQHAVLQYRALPSRSTQQQQIGEPGKLQCKPYLMDLESTNGTFINGVRLESARYYELRRGDVITLGGSSREYVLLTEQSAKTGI